METTEDVGKLKENLAATEAKAAMLDLLPTLIMQIDRDCMITYMNPAGVAALGLDLQNIVGMDCHNILQTPQCETDKCLCHQAVSTDEVITGQTIVNPAGQNIPIRFTGTPIKDTEGNITGALVSMLDLSEEFELAEGVLDLTATVMKGELSARGDVQKFTGNSKRIVQAVNDMLDAVIGPVDVMAEYIDRIAKGSIPRKIIDEYKGDFNKIKNNLNGLIDNLQGLTNAVHAIAIGDMPIQLSRHSEEDSLTVSFQPMLEVTAQLVEEINLLTGAVVEGRLDVRGDVSKFHGEFAKVVRDVNTMLDTVVRPLNVVAEYVERIASGNIPGRISDEYKGDFNEIKKNLNQCVDVVNGLVTETVRLTEATAEGRLDIRGDADKFQGNFAKIVQGINATLDAVAGPLNMATEYVDRIARGDIPGKIIDEHKGNFNELKDNLNSLIDNFQELTDAANAIAHGDMSVEVNRRSEDDGLVIAFQNIKATVSQLVGEMDMLKEAAAEGRLDIRGNAGEFPGDFARIIQGANATLNAVAGPLNVTAEYVDRIASGNIPAKITDEYKGKFNELKENLNMLVDTTNEVTKIAQEIADGSLTVEVKTRSPKDTLMVTMEKIVTYFQSVADVAEKVSNKDLSVTITPKSEQDALNHSLKRIVTNLQAMTDELQAQREQLRVSNEELESQTRALRESERRPQQQQEELRRTNGELSRQITELERQRTAVQKRNLALEKAQRLVEEKVKALELSGKYQSEFLANTAQELRPPLNSLLVLLNLLVENRNGNLIEKQIDPAHAINEAGAESFSLISDVLDISQAELDKTRLNHEEVSLRGVADYIEQNFTRMAVERGLYLKVDMAKGLPASIRTDRQRVEQIVKNLLSNAIKFTEQGGVSVRISRPAAEVALSHSRLASPDTIAISVSDTGIGIPEEKQRAISGAFQRADTTVGQRASGVGSGLSISRELTTLLGGEIQLHSKEGKGSTFALYLPENNGLPERPRPDSFSEEKSAAVSPDRQSSRELSDFCTPGVSRPRADLSDVERPVLSPRSKVKRSKVEEVKRSGLRGRVEESAPSNVKESNIRGSVLRGAEGVQDDRLETSSENKSMLIIEDDSEFARPLLDLARERGFKGLIARDGAEGLQLAYQCIPNAIILNIGVLDVNGWMVMEKLKANPETRNIPVHFISTQDRSLDAVKMGAIEYLTKPVTSAEALNLAFKKIEESLVSPVKNLLIVENDEPTQVGMVELLGGDGVEITTTATGKETYHLLQMTAFDCMVLDLGLPDILGFELLDMIKEDTRIAPLPIIVYTGKELTKREQNLLKKHSQGALIEGVKSQDRLLNEVASFLRQVESELPPDQQKKLRMSHDRDTVLNGKTLLLVDGDMRKIPALTNMFEEKGFDVFFVENGKEALKQLDARPDIDLVLMDMMMPGMDGCKVTREIRKQPRFKKLPIIALTAEAMKDERQKCLEVGVNDYLSKPVDTDKLLSVLRVWLY